jgi:protein-disulfide isomerase
MKFLIFAFLIVSKAASGQALYKLNGKVVQKSELPAGIGQSLFEAETKHRDMMQALIDESIFASHLEAEAKKRKKSQKDVAAELVKGKNPSESELKSFYEKNKARIGVPFEQVKGELTNYLKSESEQKARSELVASLKKKGGFEFLVPEVEAPVLQIDTSGAPSKGLKGSKVKIVEFADYQCPHCKQAHEVLKKFMGKMAGKVEFVFMDFPINRSGVSRRVAEGAFCANQMGKYWEYHDLAFDKQDKLTNEYALEMAKTLKLDEAKFKACIDGADAKAYVQKSLNEGERIGISGTPSVYLNGKRVLDWTEEALAKQVEKALK